MSRLVLLLLSFAFAELNAEDGAARVLLAKQVDSMRFMYSNNINIFYIYVYMDYYMVVIAR